MQDNDYSKMEQEAAQEGWLAMQALLDKEMPVAAAPRRRRWAAGWLWLWLGLVATSGGAAAGYYLWLVPPALTAPAPTAPDKPLAAAHAMPEFCPPVADDSQPNAMSDAPAFAVGGSRRSAPAPSVEADVQPTATVASMPIAAADAPSVLRAENSLDAAPPAAPAALAYMAPLPVLSSIMPLEHEGAAPAVPTAAPQRHSSLRWGMAAHLITDNFTQVAGAGLGFYLAKPLPASPRWQWQAGAAYQVRQWQTYRRQTVPVQSGNTSTAGGITQEEVKLAQAASRHELVLPVSLSYQVAARWRFSAGLSVGYLVALREPISIVGSHEADFVESPNVETSLVFSNLYENNQGRSALAYKSHLLSGASVQINRLQVMPTAGLSFALSQRVSLHGTWQYEALPTLTGGGYEVQRHYTTLGISRHF